MGRRDKVESFEATKESNNYVILAIITIIFLVILLGLKVFSPAKEIEPDINADALETAVKSALITIANDEFGDIEENGVKYAEGHKVLRSEINGGKVYAYTVAEYGQYKVQAADSTEKPDPVSATTKPMVLVFTVEEIENTDDKKNEKEKKYVYYRVYMVEGEADDAWEESLETFFPMDLVEAAKVDYADDFYQNQIRAYLVVENTSTENEEQNVVENKNEDEKADVNKKEKESK